MGEYLCLKEANSNKSICIPEQQQFKADKCMPTPPERVGREFVMKYFTIMNKSPQHLHCFYTESASFIHDGIYPMQRRTVIADCKQEIQDVMLERAAKFKHSKTKVSTLDAIETLDDGVIVQVNGEISFNEQPMRPFSQSFILIRKTPFHYYVQNDIFRFCDYVLEPEAKQRDLTDQEPKPMADDWGTQCEEFDPEPRVSSTRNESEGDGIENEVKLDTSDSGLSSDAEKVIMDIQSQNLKNILQEPRTITKESVMKRGPTPPAFVETEPSTELETTAAENDISETQTQSFRDSCILMINNTVNPNIEFDDAKRDEIEENGATQNSGEKMNTSKNDEYTSNKRERGFKKRKDRRKSKGDISNEKYLDEPNNEPEKKEPTTKTRTDDPSTLASENMSPENAEHEPEASTEIERETPKIGDKISYADLAKTGKDEWVDELVARRDSMSDKVKSRSTLPRRSSRSERTTPQHEFHRSSPKNDMLQVFVGNIPHSANEDDIRQMFSRFGRLSRVRLHSNSKKEWLPRYAFISYENVHAVQQCLMKKHTFYWPEHSQDAQKLNVNGDPSVDVWDDSGNRRLSDCHSKTREFKQFSKHFVLNSKETDNKSLPESTTNITDTMKSEPRKGSTRA